MSLQTLQGRNVALVFPGQGSQSVGMGKDLIERSTAARRILQEADNALQFPLSELCFTGPADQLEDTWNAQPAILAVSIAALEAIRERMRDLPIEPASMITAGHSLGQFSSMVAAGVIDFPTALKLVRERGRLMKQAGVEKPGGMAAVLGLDEAQLASVCAEASDLGVINVANANCPGQIVISGEVAALEKAMDLAKTAGAKRVARLGVSIASHSPLMADASNELATLIDRIEMSEPAFPIVGNVSGDPITTAADLRIELRHHMERPVNWTKSVQTMVSAGANTFVEVGSGTVLGGLIKRIDRSVTNLGTAELLA
ncbi:MAG: ACP S-malonyltransferase [Thermomicrobiales bacterium]